MASVSTNDLWYHNRQYQMHHIDKYRNFSNISSHFIGSISYLVRQTDKILEIPNNVLVNNNYCDFKTEFETTAVRST